MPLVLQVLHKDFVASVLTQLAPFSLVRSPAFNYSYLTFTLPSFNKHSQKISPFIDVCVVFAPFRLDTSPHTRYTNQLTVGLTIVDKTCLRF